MNIFKKFFSPKKVYPADNSQPTKNSNNFIKTSIDKITRFFSSKKVATNNQSTQPTKNSNNFIKTSIDKIIRFFSSNKVATNNQSTQSAENTKKFLENSIDKEQKETIDLANLIYDEEKKIQKTLKNKRKEKQQAISEVFKSKPENSKPENSKPENSNKKKSEKHPNYLLYSLLYENNLWKKTKNFFKTKQRRSPFLKRAGILGVGVILYTVLCVFYPPALGALIPILGTIALGSCIKLMHRSKIKEKNLRQITEKIEKTEHIDEKIQEKFNVLLLDKANEIKDFKTLSEEKKKEIIEKTNQKIQKYLEKNIPTKDQKKENIKNYFEEKNAILCKEYNEDIKKIEEIKKKYLALLDSTEENKVDNNNQEIYNLYTEITKLIDKDGLNESFLAEFSISHKIKKMAQSDITLTILSVAALGCSFGLLKVPKLPSSQVTPASIFADDTSKQGLQLLSVLAFSNKVHYPDSWRKSVIEIHNETAKEKMVDNKNVTQIFNQNKNSLPNMPPTYSKNLELITQILRKEIEELHDDNNNVIFTITSSTENLIPTSPLRSSSPCSTQGQRQSSPPPQTRRQLN